MTILRFVPLGLAAIFSTIPLGACKMAPDRAYADFCGREYDPGPALGGNVKLDCLNACCETLPSEYVNGQELPQVFLDCAAANGCISPVTNAGGSGGESGAGGAAGTGGGSGSSGTGGGPCSHTNGGVCGLAPQCDCPEGQSCDVTSYTTGKSACYTSKNYPQGGICVNQGECQPGLTCDPWGICKRLCLVAKDCSPSSMTCIKVLPGTTEQLPGYGVCADQCDPMNPQGICATGLTCWPFSNPGTNPGESICVPTTGAGIDGSYCQDVTKCKPGFWCGGDHYCHKFCKNSVGDSFNTSPDCPSQYPSCHRLGTSSAKGLFVGSVEYGLCGT